MKQDQVALGAVYAVKVSGRVQPVRITQALERPVYRANNFTGHRSAWRGINLTTGREVYIRSAAKLRCVLVADPVTGVWHYPKRKGGVA